MPLVPAKKEEKVAFFRARIAPWQTNAVAIGTTGAAVTALDGLVTAAEDAIAAQLVALNAYRTAVETTDTAVAAMAGAGADIISAIRTAGRTGGATVYELAQIPGPATPAPVPPPGTPYQFKVELLPEGQLVFTWKCNNPAGASGTVYQVYRRDTPTAEPTFLGIAGIRKFIDESVPTGQPQIGYVIQATRSTAIGVEGNFAVRFGTTSAGAMTASIVETAPAKMAA